MDVQTIMLLTNFVFKILQYSRIEHWIDPQLSECCKEVGLITH